MDPSALTDAQQKELSQYAAQVINSLRQQYGSPLVHVNSIALNDTNTLISQQDQDNVKGHDQNALTKAFSAANNNWKINWDAEEIGEGIQNWGMYESGNPTPTLAKMDQLKNVN